MLLLERSINDVIRIGQDVQVRILRIGKTRILVGVQAPRTVSVWRDEIAPLAAVPSESIEPETPRPFRVLVVEDDPIHAKLVSRVLTEHSVTHISIAPTAEAAIERLRVLADAPASDAPDLVLMDLKLPDGSGLDALRVIRAAASLRMTPVVMMSSSGREADVSECMQAGANAFISKADNHEEFRRVIGRVAEFWRHARRVA